MDGRRASNEPGYGPTSFDGVLYSDGWYYDDFSDETFKECQGPNKRRVVFTSAAKPALGVDVVLDCGS